jgi:hypothetical protein
LEGRTGSATLLDDDHEAFEVFMEWLYRNALTSLMPPSDKKSGGVALRLKIAKTMVFADKYCLDELSDRAMSIWFRGRDKTLLAAELEMITAYVVDNSAPTCRARSYLARMWAKDIRNHHDGKHYKPGQSGLDAFINDSSFVIQVFNHIGNLQCLRQVTACNFHLHGKSTACPYKDQDTHVPVPIAIPKKRSGTAGIKKSIATGGVKKRRLH